MRTGLRNTVALAVAGMATSFASAGVEFGFFNITNNGVANAGTAPQYKMIVSGAFENNVNYAIFRFENAGPALSSITDIYFQDGTLLGIQSITGSSAGVSFAEGASPPGLPGAGNFNPQTTIQGGGYFASTDSTSPTQPNGVNPGEWLEIKFELTGTNTWLNTVAALQAGWIGPGQGTLRVGIHVQGFEDNGSESFIDNPVPLPSAGFLALAGIGAIGIRRRRTV